MEANEVTFPSGDGKAELSGIWHLPTRKATNGALIAMHGLNLDKEHSPLPEISRGAADLGLTVLRFNFRYVNNRKAGSHPDFGMDDLRGAYNFLLSFGKEIRPKRIYLLGYSRGARVAMLATGQKGYLPGPVAGIATLMMALHDLSGSEWVKYPALETLTMPKLFVGGEYDPYASGEELTGFVKNLPEPVEMQILNNSGHVFEPQGLSDLTEEESATLKAANLQKATELVLTWLEKQDKVRIDLRT